MDASAYLRNQGWRGHGHSLDHTNRGIRKPLLISQKVDVLGVGLNKHAAVSDQWWLRAFDQGLKSLGTGEETTLAQVKKHGIARGGLFGRFVKGEKIPGSIGQSLLPTPEDSEDTSPSTPVKLQDEARANMAADAQSEGAVGHGNVDEAPSSTMKTTDRKRKRDESIHEKRARREIEKQQKMRANSLRKKQDGTTVIDEAEEARRAKEKEVNRRANDLVLECQRRGIIPPGPNEIRKGLVPTGANATAMMSGQPSEELQKIIEFAGIDPQATSTPKSGRKTSVKAQKYAREKAKHEVKRAAKAYLLGEKLPHKMSLEEKKARKARKKLNTDRKKAEAAKKEVERMQKREERAEKKKRNKAEKAAIDAIVAEQEAAAKSDEGVPVEEEEIKGNGFDDGADEIKLGLNSSGRVKKIPGVGPVTRYPTKGEKRAKKLKAQEIRAGLSEEELQARVDAVNAQREAQENGEAPTNGTEKKEIPPEKLEEYQKRADEKGVTLGEYIRRREEKNAIKRAEKMGVPFERVVVRSRNGGKKNTAVKAEPVEESNGGVAVGSPPDDLGFVVDTAGDSKLASTSASEIKVTSKSTSSDKKKGPTDFSVQAIAALSQARPIDIVDETGKEIFKWEPSMDIPLDPRIWEGQVVKDLPKKIRRARRDWMAAKREKRKAEKAGGTAPAARKPKGQRKVEAREAFVKQILFESRKAYSSGRGGAGVATIEGVPNVSLVKIETRNGPYSKAEVSSARTVARRTQRNVKRQLKADRGKGKGWKKRERAKGPRVSLTGRQ